MSRTYPQYISGRNGIYNYDPKTFEFNLKYKL